MVCLDVGGNGRLACAHDLISITSNLNFSRFRKDLLAPPLPSYNTEDKLFKSVGVTSCVQSNIHCLGGKCTNPCASPLLRL